jgi:polycystin 2
MENLAPFLAQCNTICNPREYYHYISSILVFFRLFRFTLFQIILGGFNYETLEQANRVVAPIYFVTFVFFVFFVLFNMFVAIINDSYADVKEYLRNKKSDIELSRFLKKAYDKVVDGLDLRQSQIVDIRNVISSADVNNDSKIDFNEWRNSLRVSETTKEKL